MASGKASRRKRAAQQAQAAANKHNNRPPVDRRRWVLGAVAAALLVAVIVGAALARGGETAPVAGATLTDGAEASAVFKGIPQQGVALGRPNAPVTVVEFVDLQCPFCREFAVEAMPTLIEKHVRTGKVRLELRGLAFLGPDSERGLRAALAAARQNRLFEFTELLYFNQGAENSGWLDQEMVEAAARSLPGLDVVRLVQDMDSGAVSDLIAEHAGEAERRGVNSTPTILVGRTGGELARVNLESPTDLAAVEKAISAAS
jgi:protein-disulfide isomerase